MRNITVTDDYGRRHVFDVEGYDSLQDVHIAVARAASIVKLMCGVFNNAAWALMGDARDQLRKHHAYRHRVKQAYNAAFKAWSDYERCLVSSSGMRFFHLDDMEPEIRKKYGDITDREYYEFWSGGGAHIYQKTRPLITSLWNKYRISLERHHVRDAQYLAWGMTAQAGLEQARLAWKGAVADAADAYGLPEGFLRVVFRPFLIDGVADAWYRALTLTDPATEGYDLEPDEERNIILGIKQLRDAWNNPVEMYDSAIGAVEDFEEVFRTKGEQKKSLRSLSEIRATVEAAMEAEKKNNSNNKNK